MTIICLNETESKYYVYSENGILLNRINFANITEKYGKIIAMSNNGLNLILSKSRNCILEQNDQRRASRTKARKAKSDQ